MRKPTALKTLSKTSLVKFIFSKYATIPFKILPQDFIIDSFLEMFPNIRKDIIKNIIQMTGSDALIYLLNHNVFIMSFDPGSSGDPISQAFIPGFFSGYMCVF